MHIDELRRVSRLLTPTEVCAELLALSVVEFSHTPGIAIAVALRGAEGTTNDTGRGMKLAPDEGDDIPHAERALTSVYPCLPATPEIATVLRELVWGDRDSQGPALANHACPSLQYTSRRRGEVWTQSYRYGAPLGPPTSLGSTDTTGTTIQFTTEGPIDADAIARLVAALRSRIEGLVIVGPR